MECGEGDDLDKIIAARTEEKEDVVRERAAGAEVPVVEADEQQIGVPVLLADSGQVLTADQADEEEEAAVDLVEWVTEFDDWRAGIVVDGSVLHECPECGVQMTFADLDALLAHVESEHGVPPVEFLEIYPEEEEKIGLHEADRTERITCKICGQREANLAGHVELAHGETSADEYYLSHVRALPLSPPISEEEAGMIGLHYLVEEAAALQQQEQGVQHVTENEFVPPATMEGEGEQQEESAVAETPEKAKPRMSLPFAMPTREEVEKCKLLRKLKPGKALVWEDKGRKATVGRMAEFPGLRDMDEEELGMCQVCGDSPSGTASVKSLHAHVDSRHGLSAVQYYQMYVRRERWFEACLFKCEVKGCSNPTKGEKAYYTTNLDAIRCHVYNNHDHMNLTAYSRQVGSLFYCKATFACHLCGFQLPHLRKEVQNHVIKDHGMNLDAFEEGLRKFLSAGYAMGAPSDESPPVSPAPSSPVDGVASLTSASTASGQTNRESISSPFDDALLENGTQEFLRELERGGTAEVIGQITADIADTKPIVEPSVKYADTTDAGLFTPPGTEAPEGQVQALPQARLDELLEQIGTSETLQEAVADIVAEEHQSTENKAAAEAVLASQEASAVQTVFATSETSEAGDGVGCRQVVVVSGQSWTAPEEGAAFSGVAVAPAETAKLKSAARQAKLKGGLNKETSKSRTIGFKTSDKLKKRLGRPPGSKTKNKKTDVARKAVQAAKKTLAKSKKKKATTSLVNLKKREVLAAKAARKRTEKEATPTVSKPPPPPGAETSASRRSSRPWRPSCRFSEFYVESPTKGGGVRAVRQSEDERFGGGDKENMAAKERTTVPRPDRRRTLGERKNSVSREDNRRKKLATPSAKESATVAPAAAPSWPWLNLEQYYECELCSERASELPAFVDHVVSHRMEYSVYKDKFGEKKKSPSAESATHRCVMCFSELPANEEAVSTHCADMHRITLDAYGRVYAVLSEGMGAAAGSQAPKTKESHRETSSETKAVAAQAPKTKESHREASPIAAARAPPRSKEPKKEQDRPAGQLAVEGQDVDDATESPSPAAMVPPPKEDARPTKRKERWSDGGGGDAPCRKRPRRAAAAASPPARGEKEGHKTTTGPRGRPPRNKDGTYRDWVPKSRAKRKPEEEDSVAAPTSEPSQQRQQEEADASAPADESVLPYLSRLPEKHRRLLLADTGFVSLPRLVADDADEEE